MSFSHHLASCVCRPLAYSIQVDILLKNHWAKLDQTCDTSWMVLFQYCVRLLQLGCYISKMAAIAFDWLKENLLSRQNYWMELINFDPNIHWAAPSKIVSVFQHYHVLIDKIDDKRDFSAVSVFYLFRDMSPLIMRTQILFRGISFSFSNPIWPIFYYCITIN